jgi:hypothetical protein
VALLTPVVDATIQRLKNKAFKPDPIAGVHFSRIVSLMSSAYKRHGFILERALLERLKQCPEFDVWSDAEFQVQSDADTIASGALGNPAGIIGTEIRYGPGSRTLQVDAVVYNRTTPSLRAYEIKRGAGTHDAGKRRSILRDALCTQILLKSYGQTRGLEVSETSAHVVFYYGMKSLPRPFALTGDELDKHFGWPVRAAVEAVNELFRSRLFAILSG